MTRRKMISPPDGPVVGGVTGPVQPRLSDEGRADWQRPSAATVPSERRHSADTVRDWDPPAHAPHSPNAVWTQLYWQAVVSVTASDVDGRDPPSHWSASTVVLSERVQVTVRVRVVWPHAEGVLQLPVDHWKVHAEKSS